MAGHGQLHSVCGKQAPGRRACCLQDVHGSCLHWGRARLQGAAAKLMRSIIAYHQTAGSLM